MSQSAHTIPLVCHESPRHEGKRSIRKAETTWARVVSQSVEEADFGFHTGLQRTGHRAGYSIVALVLLSQAVGNRMEIGPSPLSLWPTRCNL
jgi:hypothetical protein